MDWIVLRGLRAVGTHGALPEERGRAQPFEVDLEIGMDLSAAASSDDLAATVDYGTLAQAAVDIIEGPHCALLEALAGRIADAALADPRVDEVVVTVRKLRPPVPLDLDDAGVRLRRAR